MKLIIDLDRTEDIEKGKAYLEAYASALGASAGKAETPASSRPEPEAVDFPSESELRQALTAYGKRTGVKPRQFLRDRYGVERLSDLPTDHWGSCYAEVRP